MRADADFFYLPIEETHNERNGVRYYYYSDFSVSFTLLFLHLLFCGSLALFLLFL